MEVWLQMFVNYPPAVLAKALQRVTDDVDRMPVPAHLKRAINAAFEKEPWLSPNFESTPKPSPGRDAGGVQCWFWSDKPDVPTYLAKDCPEGIGFLAEFAKVAGKSPEESAKLFEKWVGANGPSDYARIR